VPVDQLSVAGSESPAQESAVGREAAVPVDHVPAAGPEAAVPADHVPAAGPEAAVPADHVPAAGPEAAVPVAQVPPAGRPRESSPLDQDGRPGWSARRGRSSLRSGAGRLVPVRHDGTGSSSRQAGAGAGSLQVVAGSRQEVPPWYIGSAPVSVCPAQLSASEVAAHPVPVLGGYVSGAGSAARRRPP
jgi:hypothetical protein